MAEIDLSEINNDDIVVKETPVLSVSEALRKIPNNEKGETTHTQVLKVRGMISSMRPVMKMISGEYGRCIECGELYYERYEKPLFEMIGRLTLCNNNSEKHTPATNAKTGDVLHDKDGNIIRAKAILRTWPEYRNASI